MFSCFWASWAVHVKRSQEKMQKNHTSTTAIFLFSQHLWSVEGLLLENPSLPVPPVCSQPLWSSKNNAGWRQLSPQRHHHVPPAFLESLRDPSWFQLTLNVECPIEPESYPPATEGYLRHCRNHMKSLNWGAFIWRQIPAGAPWSEQEICTGFGWDGVNLPHNSPFSAVLWTCS